MNKKLNERLSLYEELKNGGSWLGAARNFLLERATNSDRLMWGSTTEVRNLGVIDIEEMAKRIAVAAILEDRAQRKTVAQSIDEEDKARFQWWFSPSPKAHYLLEYIQGMHEHWSLDQWRISIDNARRKTP